MELSEQAGRLAELLNKAGAAAAFTGAGISTESGIPDYRSPGGQWTKTTPPQYHDFLASSDGRRRYWQYYREFFPVFARAEPNAAHRALARLQAAGRLSGVVTQNIDGLHQAAGCTEHTVHEVHGNAFVSECLACRSHQAATSDLLDHFLTTDEIPNCPVCGGPMKPRTISFGQAMDRPVLERAVQLCAAVDLLLVVGSSLSVAPASGLPGYTLSRGGKLVIINLTATPLDERAELIIRRPAGQVLGMAVDMLLGE
jgi:NAD-dependent deacetylase